MNSLSRLTLIREKLQAFLDCTVFQQLEAEPGTFRSNDRILTDSHHTLEKRALQMFQVLRRRTDPGYVVIAGGVALNTVMNGRIVRESGFKDASS